MPEELDPVELTPIEGVPDWANTFLHQLLNNPDHFGTITHAARAAGRTRWAVDEWRHKNPAFAAALAEIYEAVNNAIDDEIEHRLIELSLGGITETTEETVEGAAVDDSYRHIRKTKHFHDIKALQWLLGMRRRQRYGPTENALTGAHVTFVFNPEGAGAGSATPEAPAGTAEVIEEGETTMLDASHPETPA